MQERLGFDNDIAALEKAIKKRRKDFRELESMLSDAQLSRDMAKVSPPDATLLLYRLNTPSTCRVSWLNWSRGSVRVGGRGRRNCQSTVSRSRRRRNFRRKWREG